MQALTNATMATTNSTIELILRHFCAGPIASTSFRRIGFTLGEAGAAAQEKTVSSEWWNQDAANALLASRRRVILSGGLMPRSGRADELGIGSASPRMVEGGAVPASLMGGVWDPSAKLRRVGWFLHRNANGPERSRSGAGAANL
jgi:hypothetical protein